MKPSKRLCYGIPGIYLVLALTSWSFAQMQTVTEELEVGEAWSVHLTATPQLYTQDGYQYVLYYDADRYLQLAQRQLESQEWKHHRFPVQTQWATGAHAQVSLVVDVNGHVHVAAYRRGLSEQPPSPPATIYYRTERAHDLASLKRTHVVAPDEPNAGYPAFIEGPNDEIYFEYRLGGSGSGSQRWNVYDPERQQWEALSILLDGQGERGAYGGPRLGPDGRWHCSWTWRETSSAETTNIVAYMRSDDLRQWENAAGEALTLPITGDNEKVVVDPVEPLQGLINPLRKLGWDSTHRPIISYHKYDEAGNSQIYNARFEENQWRIVRATDWDFRWDFHGRGAIGLQVDVTPVQPIADGRLYQQVMAKHDDRGWRPLILDEETLRPVGHEKPDIPRSEDEESSWQHRHSKPESDFDVRPMEVRWISDNGKASDPATQYWLRWEVGPINERDLPVPKPWPDATPLRVYRVTE